MCYRLYLGANIQAKNDSACVRWDTVGLVICKWRDGREIVRSFPMATNGAQVLYECDWKLYYCWLLYEKLAGLI